jgi:uncharacterized protein YndB with AHSA1/START domain
MKTIKKKYLINAPSDKVWKALTDPDMIDDWGAGKAKMSEQVGFEFSLWGGDIHGKNIEVVPGKKLKQEWEAGEWESPSILTITLNQTGKTAEIELLHENIPDSEAPEIEEGWDSYYMSPLKEYVEKII